ncbi:MAG: hypothetical protein WA476_02200 [Acidobacteriaceae bacterium]
MVIEEPVKARYVSAIGIAIRHVSAVGITILSAGSVGITILSAGITIAQVRVAGVEIFQPHEGVGPFADLLFHTGVILKVRVELRMALEKLRVVDQGRRFAKLAGNFAMVVEKLIESRQVSARNVVVGGESLAILLGRRLLLRGLHLRGRRLRARGLGEKQQRCGCCTEKQTNFREPS